MAQQCPCQRRFLNYVRRIAPSPRPSCQCAVIVPATRRIFEAAALAWEGPVSPRQRDLMTCLRSASFDTLFVVLDAWPFDREPELVEVPLENQAPVADVMGDLMLDAHRDLAALSAEKRRVFGDVIAALEVELNRPRSTRYE